MSQEHHPTLHGSDIGVSIRVRDIFDPHVGRHRYLVEFVCRFDVRDYANDFSDDRPSRKITCDVCDDHEWETTGTPMPLPNPVLSRRVDWVDAPLPGIVIRMVEFRTPYIAR